MQEHLLAATQVLGGQEVTLVQELREVTQGEHLEVTLGLALLQEVQEDTQELVLLQEVQEDTLLAPEVIPEPSLLWILK